MYSISFCHITVLRAWTIVDDSHTIHHLIETFVGKGPPRLIYVKDYADAKFGCVPVAQPKTCHCGPRELPGRGTYTLSCPMVASFGLRNRDIQDFSACVMSDADA